MATRVYACFDAAGSKNPATTDLKYYFLLRAWSNRAPLARTFIDVHGVKRRRRPADLRQDLVARIRSSDLLLVILSERTASSAGLLSWEIEFAAGRCNLPIVCAYTGAARGRRIKPSWWPDVLRRVVSGQQARAVHVPFHPRALATAFRQFT
jgi:Thoeris protein ThsB, TIR-like domain